MKITNLKVYKLAIPFSLAISHNLAKRQESEAIVIIAESDNGFIGIGEGTPRQYVTEETLPGCIDAAIKMGKLLIHQEFDKYVELNQLFDQVATQPLAQQNPSAWCAVELACLDLFAKSKQVPLWQLFTDTPVNDTFTYSAVIPLLSREKLNSLLPIIKSLNIEFVKVKVSSFQGGVEYLTYIRKVLGPDVDIRVDANGAFSATEAIEFIQTADTAIGISCFEQPVAKGDLKGFKTVTEHWVTMADESICGWNDLENLIKNHGCSGFNIRLSKCGGFRECLKFWKHALEKDFFCQLGCHVGETGILSAAGRHLATLCENIRYLEGGYSNFLLESDICNEDVHFGNQGKAGLLEGHGLSVTIKNSALKKYGNLVAELL